MGLRPDRTLIVFAETGLVFAPFLPGDSLLFVTGAAAGAAGWACMAWCCCLLRRRSRATRSTSPSAAAASPWLVARFRGRVLKKRGHLALTRAYFRRFGPWAIVVARFMMPWCAVGALPGQGAGRAARALRGVQRARWHGLVAIALVYAGAWLGALPFVKSHIGSITIGIVALSLLPVVLAAVQARARARPAGM